MRFGIVASRTRVRLMRFINARTLTCYEYTSPNWPKLQCFCTRRQGLLVQNEIVDLFRFAFPPRLFDSFLGLIQTSFFNGPFDSRDVGLVLIRRLYLLSNQPR